jgi:hypothetical protein
VLRIERFDERDCLKLAPAATLLNESFTIQPKVPAHLKAGAFGWAVNKHLQDAARSTTVHHVLR